MALTKLCLFSGFCHMVAHDFYQITTYIIHIYDHTYNEEARYQIY